MTREELAQDLAYARTLAEEGRATPLVGGAYLVLLGVLLAIAYTAHWAWLTYGGPPNMSGFIWMAFGLSSGLGSAFVRSRIRDKPGATSFTNQVDRAVWRGVVTAILVVVLACVGRAIFLQDPNAPNAIMAAGFGLYGVALGVTASIGEEKWLNTYARLAFLFSLVLWVFMNQPWAYLVAAAASTIVLLAPGLIMMRREPKTTV